VRTLLDISAENTEKFNNEVALAASLLETTINEKLHPDNENCQNGC
jgi:hypothetical protein